MSRTFRLLGLLAVLLLAACDTPMDTRLPRDGEPKDPPPDTESFIASTEATPVTL